MLNFAYQANFENMTTQDTLQPDVTPTTEPTDSYEVQQHPVRKPWRAGVAGAIIVTLAAWCAMMFNPYVSFWLAAAGIVLAIVSAVRVGRGLWRDLGITCAIAAGVLMLVYLIIHFALQILVASV